MTQLAGMIAYIICLIMANFCLIKNNDTRAIYFLLLGFLVSYHVKGLS